jgi:hypothetical protein
MENNCFSCGWYDNYKKKCMEIEYIKTHKITCKKPTWKKWKSMCSEPDHAKNREVWYTKDISPKLQEKLTEFDKIVEKMRNTLIAKNNDYGNDNISQLGLKGIFVRTWDKVSRLKQLVWEAKDPKVKDESVSDTFMDLANYAIIALIFKRGKWN